MTKKQKKWVVILSCGSAVAVLLLAAVHFWLSGMRSYALHLPDFADLKSVTLTRRGGEEVELVDGDGDMKFWKGGAATLFVYQQSSARDGEYFIEQPYNGIYEISGDEYNAIEKYVS